MEGDGQELLTKDDLARCSRWRQVCWLKDDCLNGGPLGIVSTTSAALFFLDDQGGYGFFAREDRVRVFFLCLSLIFLVSLPLCEYVCFSPQCIWLEVHLYRKSLHVLFKEILQ